MKEAMVLGEQIEGARRHLAALMDRAGLSAETGTTLAEALEAFSTTLEELRVAEVELREQNDQLALAHQAAENERHRYQELFDTAPDAYLVTDPYGLIQEGNRAAGELLGLPADLMIGKPLVLYVRDEDHRLFREFLESLKVGIPEPRELEIGFRPRIRKAFPGSVRVAVVHSARGRVTGLRWLIRDLTENKRVQERALQSERLAAIGQMVAGLAHESGNALQRSQACTEMLTLQLQDQPKALALLNTIQKAQNDLQRLYDEVRGYAASIILKRGKLELREVLRSAWAHLAPMRQGRKVQFREIGGEIKPVAGVDAFALEQVFRNILENSLSMCADPVEITVLWRECQIDGKPAWKVAISDNGPGLTDEQRARIFEPFYTTKTRGTGLGMAIAKRIVEAHGGGIAPGPNPGPGTEIVLTLPKEP
jgi:PAS domain S-box-containing protein